MYEQGGIRPRLTADEGTAERWLKFGGWEGLPPASGMFAPEDAGRSGLADACCQTACGVTPGWTTGFSTNRYGGVLGSKPARD